MEENIKPESTSEFVTEILSANSSQVPNLVDKPKNKTHKKVSKVYGEWSDENVFKLLYFVRSHRTMWVAQERERGDSVRRKEMWDDLSKRLFRSKYSPAETNAKWTHLRVQYRNYTHRKSLPGANRIIWRFYPYMQFIDHVNTEQVFPDGSDLVRPLDF